MKPQAGASDCVGAKGLTKSLEPLRVLTEGLVEWTLVGLLDSRCTLPLLGWWGAGRVLGVPRDTETHPVGGKSKTHVTPVGLLVIPHRDLAGNILSLKINFPLCFI